MNRVAMRPFEISKEKSAFRQLIVVQLESKKLKQNNMKNTGSGRPCICRFYSLLNCETLHSLHIRLQALLRRQELVWDQAGA